MVYFIYRVFSVRTLTFHCTRTLKNISKLSTLNMDTQKTSCTGETTPLETHKVVPATDDMIDQCVQVLQRGGVIALPTDTIYGFAVSALDSEAIRRLYEVKGRERTKPIAICVGGANDVDRWAHSTVPSNVLHRLLPGPVTLVFNRRDSLNPSLNPGRATVGTRVPDHPFIVKLAQRFDGPIGLTSANLSADQSTLNIKEFSNLWHKLDLIVDGGSIGGENAGTEQSRAGSTVVDLSIKGVYSIIRPGCACEETSRILEEYGGLRKK